MVTHPSARLIGALVCCAFLPFYLQASATSALRINSSISAPYSNPQRTGFEDRLAIELYKRLGIAIEIVDLPPERGLRNVDQGIDDGSLSRAGGISRFFPNVVQLSEKTYDMEYIAYSRDDAVTISDWESMRNLNVGYVRGWKIFEARTRTFSSVVTVTNAKQLFEMLSLGRIDVALYNRWGGLQVIRNSEHRNVRLNEPPLARQENFFCLHKRHIDLVPLASKKLREMKADGSYEEILKQTLGRLKHAQ